VQTIDRTVDARRRRGRDDRDVRTERPAKTAPIRTVGELLRSAGTLARLVDWRLTSTPWQGFGEPYAGQRLRRQTVETLLHAFRPDAIVETGTFLGFTTRRLAQMGVPVYSAEINPRFWWLARMNLRDVAAGTLVCSDSVWMLDELRRRRACARPFAYLDAHWEDRLPLADEVDRLLRGWPDAIVVIEDCLVPHDLGYRYDVYDGVPLSRDLLDLPPRVATGYPAAPATDETGDRSGTLYLAHGDDARSALADARRAGLVT
jgi:hypothetical protein